MKLVLGDYEARRDELVGRLTEVITECPEFAELNQEAVTEMFNRVLGVCMLEAGFYPSRGYTIKEQGDKSDPSLLLIMLARNALLD